MTEIKNKEPTQAKARVGGGVSKQRKPRQLTAAAIKKLVKVHKAYMDARVAFIQEYSVSASYVNGLLCDIK